MARTTGTFRIARFGDEEVRAFCPLPLPPVGPALVMDEYLQSLHGSALAAISRLSIAGVMVPSEDWFLYGFVRKEAVISSQIEGIEATLQDVLEYEATQKTDRPTEVREVCNSVDALSYARRQIARPKGLPLSMRLLCEMHKRLMKGSRGADQQPGRIRTSQNWIGGTRPGNAVFVPPPPDAVPEALSALERWIHASDLLPTLVRAGLAHVQFETIHPFLDGNGRIGRLLITLLLEHWDLLRSPLLYLSLPFKQNREEYYRRLSAVRTEGDWEGWTAFFLECVHRAADNAVATAQTLFMLLNRDRQTLVNFRRATIPAVRLFDCLPVNPMITLPQAQSLLKTSKPTAAKAIDVLLRAKVLKETTGKRRDRVYAYQGYLQLLTLDMKMTGRPANDLFPD